MGYQLMTFEDMRNIITCDSNGTLELNEFTNTMGRTAYELRRTEAHPEFESFLEPALEVMTEFEAMQMVRVYRLATDTALRMVNR